MFVFLDVVPDKICNGANKYIYTRKNNALKLHDHIYGITQNSGHMEECCVFIKQ